MPKQGSRHTNTATPVKSNEAQHPHDPEDSDDPEESNDSDDPDDSDGPNDSDDTDGLDDAYLAPQGSISNAGHIRYSTPAADALLKHLNYTDAERWQMEAYLHSEAYIKMQTCPYPNPNSNYRKDVYMQIYEAVRQTCLPNFLSARISMPHNLNMSVWRNYLADYKDTWLCDPLEFGWPMDYEGTIIPKPTNNNHNSAWAYPPACEQLLG